MTAPRVTPINDKLLEKTIAFQLSPLFGAAKGMIPNYEVEDTKKLLCYGPVADSGLNSLPSDDEIRAMRVSLRYQNPICSNPGCDDPERAKRRVHGGGGKHKWCSCCHIVAYCDEKCQRADRKRHKVWAAQLPDSPRPASQDPQAPVVASMDEQGRIVERLSVNAQGEVVSHSYVVG
jgi:hypothetical protein